MLFVQFRETDGRVAGFGRLESPPEIYDEGRLASREGLEQQTLGGEKPRSLEVGSSRRWCMNHRLEAIRHPGAREVWGRWATIPA